MSEIQSRESGLHFIGQGSIHNNHNLKNKMEMETAKAMLEIGGMEDVTMVDEDVDAKDRFADAEDPTVFGELVSVYTGDGERDSSPHSQEEVKEPCSQFPQNVEELTHLKERVVQLEHEVISLQGELRLMKRKMRNYDPHSDDFQEILERNILRILDGQNWRISRLMLKEADERSRSGRVIKPNRKFTHSGRPSTSSTHKTISDLYDSDEDFVVPGDSRGNEFDDPNYNFRYDSNTENIRPKGTKIRRPAQGTARRGRGRPSAESRRVIVVKKVEPKSPSQDDYRDDIEYVPASSSEPVPVTLSQGTVAASAVKKDKVISAGDVSVILDDDDDEVSGTKSVRVKKSGAPNRPRVMKCSLCPKMFRDQHDVSRHERTHTGEKPFFCQICGPNMRFTQTYHLQRHTTKYHV